VNDRAADGGALLRPVRLECIDGLRGWAALVVVLSHLWGQFARHVVTTYDHPFLRIISDGHLSVLIFFVLSGVALSLRFTRNPQPVSLVGLMAARYVRLVVPILATTLIVYLLIVLHLASSPEAAQLTHSDIFLGARHDRSTTLLDVFTFSFYSVLFDYDQEGTFNTSLWTMPVEFQGSMLIFGLLLFFSWVPRLRAHYRMLIVGVLSIVLLALSKQLAACFTAGYVLSELVHAPKSWHKWLPAAALVVVAIAFGMVAAIGRQEDTGGTLLAIGIVMAVLFWPVLQQFFSNAPSVWLGRVSFPLYLIHVPVIGAVGAIYLLLLRQHVPAELATHVTVALALAVCLVSARLLLPVERLSIRLSRAAGTLRLPHWAMLRKPFVNK